MSLVRRHSSILIRFLLALSFSFLTNIMSCIFYLRRFANYTDYLTDKLPHVGKSDRFNSMTLTNALAPPLETMQEIRLNAHRSDYRTELASTHGKRLSTFIIYATRCRGHYERSFSPTTRSSPAKPRFNDALWATWVTTRRIIKSHTTTDFKYQ